MVYKAGNSCPNIGAFIGQVGTTVMPSRAASAPTIAQSDDLRDNRTDSYTGFGVSSSL